LVEEGGSIDATGGDLGAVLLSGALPVAEGAPAAPVFHPDPMLEFYKSLCAEEIAQHRMYIGSSWDPMMEEIATVSEQAVQRPISFPPSPTSPSPARPDEVFASSEYTLQPALWDKVAKLNMEAVALGYNNVIHFGPGI
jgi:hypothetical protein